ncbi:MULTISPECIES: response regulator transcription factor [Clostridium]|uniref:Response regulator transcription factor n=1 Tax=Clostridium frigoriphilum TaxID=443253 RepID=A0ABU7UNL7_9CLOT|nr:response regulator transcription factor [Clostridium sp. DSM 17811]MBU3100078.1 response regulator transcription factor [Clostridium sp. DSM 17811]
MEDIKILIVEDDKDISNMIKRALIKEGYGVSCAFDGQEAFNVWGKENFKLFILDIMLPKIDGIEVMRRIRMKSMVPILMVSAKAEESDRIIGLGLGADDYLVKPFAIAELIARVKALLRRYMYYSSRDDIMGNIIEYGEIKFDLDNYTAIKKDKTINLRAKEYELLKLFFKNPNKVFTKSQIFSSVWREEYLGDDNTVMVHIRRLRNKIEDNPDKPKYIETVWGIGYRLGSLK